MDALLFMATMLLCYIAYTLHELNSLFMKHYVFTKTHYICIKACSSKHKMCCRKPIKNQCMNCFVVGFLQDCVNRKGFPDTEITVEIINKSNEYMVECISRGLDFVFMKENCTSLLL